MKDSILAPGRAECNTARRCTLRRLAARPRRRNVDGQRRRTARFEPSDPRAHSSNATEHVMAHPQKNPGTAAVLSLIVPGDRAVLQRRLPARHLLAHRHTGLLDRHGRPVRLGVSRHRRHDGPPPRRAEEPGARLIRLPPTQDIGRRDRTPAATRAPITGARADLPANSAVPSPGTPLAQSADSLRSIQWSIPGSGSRIFGASCLAGGGGGGYLASRHAAPAPQVAATAPATAGSSADASKPVQETEAVMEDHAAPPPVATPAAPAPAASDPAEREDDHQGRGNPGKRNRARSRARRADKAASGPGSCTRAGSCPCRRPQTLRHPRSRVLTLRSRIRQNRLVRRSPIA